GADLLRADRCRLRAAGPGASGHRDPPDGQPRPRAITSPAAGEPNDLPAGSLIPRAGRGPSAPPHAGGAELIRDTRPLVPRSAEEGRPRGALARVHPRADGGGGLGRHRGAPGVDPRDGLHARAGRGAGLHAGDRVAVRDGDGDLERARVVKEPTWPISRSISRGRWPSSPAAIAGSASAWPRRWPRRGRASPSGAPTRTRTRRRSASSRLTARPRSRCAAT